MSDALIHENKAPSKPNKGIWAWALLFATVIVPIIAPIVVFIAEIVAHRWYRKKNDAGNVNSRNASNWVFTYALFSLAALLLFVIAANLAFDVPSIRGVTSVVPWLVIGAWVVMSGITFYYAIVGIVAAIDGRSYDPRFAVRVVRGQRVWTPQD